MFEFLTSAGYRKLLTRIEAMEEAQEAMYDRFRRREATETMRAVRQDKRQETLELEAAQVLNAAKQTPQKASNAVLDKVQMFKAARSKGMIS